MVTQYTALQHRTKTRREEINGVPWGSRFIGKNPQRNKLEATETQNHGKLCSGELKVTGMFEQFLTLPHQRQTSLLWHM